MNHQTHSSSKHFLSARSAQSVTRGLAWFSIGLGLAELLMPRTVARAVGLQGRENLLQAYGLREIATGIGLLTSRSKAPWLWARVGGDALDLATLGTQLGGHGPRAHKAMTAMVAVAGVAALDAACAQATGHEEQRQAQRVPRDYSDRRGLPLPPDEMRGQAREDGFRVPSDMKIPDALKPYSLH
jgi:hypothetical protein